MLVAGSTKAHNDAIHLELADPGDHIGSPRVGPAARGIREMSRPADDRKIAAKHRGARRIFDTRSHGVKVKLVSVSECEYVLGYLMEWEDGDIDLGGRQEVELTERTRLPDPRKDRVKDRRRWRAYNFDRVLDFRVEWDCVES